MLISICVCTYNRADILGYCLQSIGKLSDPRPRHDVEVIVVDNNSNDHTEKMVKDLIPGFPFEIRYVFEQRQGLSAARNRAIGEAKGSYIAFLDDECTLKQNWLAIAIADIEQFCPAFIGGPYVGAFLPAQRPEWFKRDYGNAYFMKFHLERGFRDQFRASGGNILVRRDVFDELRFDVGLGMTGRTVGVGEETDLQERFLGAHVSERVFYEPALAVAHFILPAKMRLPYRAKLMFAAGRGSAAPLDLAGFLSSLSKVVVFAIVSPIRCVFRNRKKYPHWQNDLYERAIPQTCFHTGRVARYLHDRWSRIL